MKKPKHIKPKHLMERIMAVLLSVSMVLTILNLTAFAMPFDEDTIRIVGFGELSNEVKEQTLKEGALESDIAFPESLLVTVEKYKLLEKLDSKELTETKEKKTKEDKSKEKTKEEKKTKDKKTDADEEDPLAEDKEGVKDPDKKTKTETDKELSEDEEAAEDEKEATEEDEKINEQKDASTQESSSETEQGSKDESVQDSSDTDTPASESSENAATEESPEAEPASEDNAGDDQGNDAVEESETSGGEEAPEETDNSSDAGNDSARAGFSFSDFFKARTVFAAEQDDQLEVSEDQPEEGSSEVSEEVGDEEPESESEQEAVQEEAEEESGDETALEEAKDEESDDSTLEESEDEEDDEKALKKSEDEAGDKKALKKSEDEEEPEYETEVEDVVLEGVTWELDKKNSSFAKFTSDEPGAKFVYVPVVPEGFKIACDYPTITVTIEEPLEKEIRSAPFSQSCVVDGVYITVFADEGVFPVDARLTAERASDQTRASAEEAVEEQRGEDCNVVASYVFDIKIVDEDWREIQPDTSKGSVKVAFSLDEVSNDNLDVEIYHIVEDGGTCAQRLDASEEGDTMVAETEGFSAYTLQVTYDVKLYNIATLPVKLSQILNKVVLSGTPVSAPIPSDASLITVTPDQNGDYDIDVTGTFSSVESLNVELSDGNVYEILLTQGYKQAGGGSLIYETGFNQPATDLVDVILGKGIVATNQQKNGTVYTFGNGDVDIGLPAGILLDTSGKIPNTTKDPDLAALCSSLGVQYGGDTSVLEFEMQATGTELVFNYAFGSAEFNQSPNFNDVFGLFISINGGPYQNIALITRSDGTQVPVTIVNLRAGIDGTEMNNGKSTTLGPSVTHTLFTEKALTLLDITNGISNVFTASQLVNIGDKIKLKFAICDVGDRGVDSYVFIEAGSLQFNAPDGKNDYYGEEIHNLDPGAEYEITCGGDTHPVTSSSAGRIPMEGTDDNGDSYSFLGETITIVKKGDGVHQDSPPQTLTVADRPEVVDLDTSQGSREISTTDTSIVLTLDPSDPDRMRQEYRLFDGYGNPISGYDWVNAGDQGGNLHFDGLDPDTEYIVKIYVPATDDYPKSFTTGGVRIKTDPEPLPPPVKRTEVVVHGGGSPVSQASVKDLDDYTQEQTGQKVIVRLNIIPEDETAVDPATVSYVDANLKTQYPLSSNDHIFAEYMDMNVTRQIDDGPIEDISDVERVVEIAVGYDLTGKLDPVVYRERDGNITVLDKLTSRPSGNYQDGKVYISGNTIYIYEQYFSDTYAVGYYTYENPVKTTEVVVHDGAGPISNASADKLDDYTQEQDGQRVLVRLNITPEDESSVAPSTVSYVDTELKTLYTTASADHIFAEYMDMNVTRQINNGPVEYIPDVERVIEIAVGYDLTDKLDPVVFREQGGTVTVLDRLQSRPAGNYQAGKVYIDGNTIYIYEQYFSDTYAVGYHTYEEPDPPPPPVKKTEVVVHGGGSTISSASADKLDDYTQEQDGQKVLVRLNITPEDEATVNPATVTYVEDDIKKRYKNYSDDHIFAEYMEMNVTRQINDGPIEYIPDVERVIEIAVNYDLTDKLDPVVFREQGGDTTILDKLPSRPAGNYQAGKVYIDGNTIYIYEQNFSDTYAVGYHTYEAPDKKTEVVVNGGTGTISQASANKLDDYTQEQDGQKVLVRLNITPEDESSVKPATVAYVDADLKSRYKTYSDDHIFAEYMDMNVTRQINNGPIENIADVERVIEIALDYDLTDKLEPVVFREHDGNTTVLDKLDQRPTGNYPEGKVYIDGNTIYIYEQYFPDTYAVGYHTYEAPDKKTEVVVKEEQGSPISQASANKLDDYTQEQEGQKVLVRLNITPEDEASVNPSTVAYVDTDLEKRYATYSADHIFAEYMDMNVTRQINDGPTENIPDVERVIEIAVGYDLTDKLEPVVFREHGGNTIVLDKLQQRPAGNYQEGTVYIDDNTIYIYAQHFSTYAVGYHTYQEPEKTTELVVDAGGGSISQASVRGLDDYTKEQSGQKVLVRMKITAQDVTDVDAATVAYVDTDLKARFPTYSADHIFAEYMDVSVTRQINDGLIEGISDVGRVVEIEIGYDLTDKLEPVVYREHGGTITILDKLDQRPSGNYQEGKVYIDGNTICVYSQYFSTYAIGYHTYEAPPAPAPTPDPSTPQTTPDPQSPQPVVTHETTIAPVMGDPAPEPPVIKVVGRAPKTYNLYVEKKVWILLLVLELLLIGAVAATNIFFCRISKKEKPQRKWIMALCRVGALLIFITVALVAQINFDYIKSQAMYKDIKYEYVQNQSVSEKAQRIAAQHGPQQKEYWKKKDIDVAKMAEEYPDIVGWILFENEDISYPIMYSGDNYTYLQSAYNGNWAYAGAIFVDELSSPDFSDRNTLIYGHNMGDKSMFGKLKYYVLSPDYYEDHQYFQIHTANKVYRYQIFVVEEVGDDDDVYYTYGRDPEKYYGTLIDLIQNSQVEKRIDPESLEHIVTLSTCTSADDRRLIICGARVDEEDN